MPRKFELTWQAGSSGRSGRWRKKYKGRVLYFSCGACKSDLDGYHQALEQWRRKKAEIDAEEANRPKPYQADYERSIEEWTLALQWSRENGDEGRAERAKQKLGDLQRRLSQTTPPALVWGDRVCDIGPSPAMLQSAYEDFCEIVPALRCPEPGTPGVIVPPQWSIDLMDGSPTRIAKEVWKDRLESQRRKGRQTAATVATHVESFLAAKRAQVSAGEMSAGRYDPLRVHLFHFRDWLGGTLPVGNINGKTITDYYTELLRGVSEKQWSPDYAKDRLNAVRTFARWLWTLDLIELPKILGSKELRISKKVKSPEVYTIDEVKKLIAKATARTKLYLLLMLNCGMTQKDISDLRHAEVDWERGKISRKRSKTAAYENVPTVTYKLWSETFRLLVQEKASESDTVLTNQAGGRLKVEELDANGKLRKIDNINTAFNRLKRDLKISKPLKLFRKTSATLLRSNKHFSGIEHVFLGHAPRSISDRHYAQVPQQLLDEAIEWLGGQYGIE